MVFLSINNEDHQYAFHDIDDGTAREIVNGAPSTRLAGAATHAVSFELQTD